MDENHVSLPLDDRALEVKSVTPFNLSLVLLLGAYPETQLTEYLSPFKYLKRVLFYSTKRT